MTINVLANLEVVFDEKELGRAIFQYIVKEYFDDDFDDAGCDWITDYNGNTYIGGPAWQVSSNKKVADLVDAANILILGQVLKMDDI